MGRLNYITNIRGIAILFIVMGHCLLLINRDTNSMAFDILTSIFANGTTIFVFISGFLFHHLLYKYQFKSFIISKMKYVLIPYVIVSIPAILFRYNDFEIGNSVRYHLVSTIIDNPMTAKVLVFLTAGVDQLWFIPMIFLYYLFSPLLRILNGRKYFYYSIPFLTIITILVSRYDDAQAYIHFVSVYIIGMCASKHKDKLLNVRKRFIAASFLLFVALTVLEVLDCQTNFVYNPLGANHFINTISKLVLAFILIMASPYYEKIVSHRMSYWANISFGIFFLHYFAIYIIRYYKPGVSPVWAVIPYFIVIMTFSVMIIQVIKKIFKKHSKLIIGC